jgi:CheY-like chemotaxis protein
MTCVPPFYKILLVDDEVTEFDMVQRILKALTNAPIKLDHVEKCSAAVRLLNTHDYDLVLLDNRLSRTVSAQFSVPFIASAFSRAQIAIISNNIDEPYLNCPKTLGVDYVIDKRHMISFLSHKIQDALLTVHQ